MSKTFIYWQIKSDSYFKIVGELGLTPLPPPPPPPPENIEFAEYVKLMSKWECAEFAPALIVACG